ncbi:MAG: hypothetical protein CMP48_01900 [Rickettsiales bacterium]|nr:hypothetical protein [Rickettsiales bacterium]
MGVVIKQSFWGSLLAYLGVVIGFLNTIYLRPLFLDLDEIGLITMVVSNALLIAPFVAVGMPATYIKYFPYFQQDEFLNRQFFSFQLVVIILANILLALLVWAGFGFIEKYYQADSSEYLNYVWISVIITLFSAIFLQLHSYSRTKLDVVLPNGIKEVGFRLGSITAIILLGLKLISLQTTIYLFVAIYIIPVVILFYNLYKKYNLRLTWSFSQIKKQWISKMANFGGYSLLLAGSGSIYSNISFLMIPAMLSLEANGIYSTCFYIGIVIEMPKRAMGQIVSPLISTHFKTNDFKEINNLYKKVSHTLTIISILFFIGILNNLSDLFSLIPKGSVLANGYYVVLFISISKVVDLAFSINSEILVYSKFKKLNLYYYVMTALLMLVLNYSLIPIYGISGAAFGFLITTFVFNLLKSITLKIKLGLSPFTKKHLGILLFSSLVTITFYFLPLTNNALWNIIIRSVLMTIVYVVGVYIFKFSNDINNLIENLAKKYLKISF